MAVPFSGGDLSPALVGIGLAVSCMNEVQESNYNAKVVLVMSKDIVASSSDIGTVDVSDTADHPVIRTDFPNNGVKAGPKHVVFHYCFEYCQLMPMFDHAQFLEAKAQFHKVVDEYQLCVQIFDQDGDLTETINSFMASTMKDQSMSDGSSDGGIYSEPLFHDGTLLHDIGKALAWVYCNTRLCSLCQDMPGRKNCIRFSKMLPKVVVLASPLSENEMSRAGYVASVSSYPPDTYICEVHNFEDYQVIVDYPRQLHVLHNLMLQGKLTKEQCKNESKNFIEYVRDKCKKISLFSANCIFAENLDSKSIFEEIMYHSSPEKASVAAAANEVDEAFDDDDVDVDGESDVKQDHSVLSEGRSFSPSVDVIIVVEDPDESDDGEPVWMISSSVDCSVRSENCEVLHLNSNMVAASLKQSGLITDRAYNMLTTDQDTLTRNALKYLCLIIQRRHCYHLFTEAAQALNNRAMKNSGYTVKTKGNTRKIAGNTTNTTGNTTEAHSRHVNNISEQNNKSGKTGKQQQKQSTLTDENLKNLETLNLADGDRENISRQGKDAEETVIERLNTSDADQKRSFITVNLLFAMIEDTKHLPYDFEVQLRKAVLERKVDVSSLRNNKGCSLLHFVLLQNRPQFIQPLFRTGCWKELQNLTVEIGKSSEHEGKTAADIVIDMRSRKLQKEFDTYTVWEKSLNLIHCEARIGNFAGVKRWLEYSSDLHTELDCMNSSTLYWACIGGNIDIVKLLLSLKVDYRQINTRKESLLHAACMMGHHHLIEILVNECEVDFTLKDTAKKTPALRASENGDEKCLAKLVECGMPKERLGSILAIAGHYGRVAFLRFVMDKYHVDPQSKDDAGKTALHRASEQGRLDVLRYLFTKNLNFEEADSRRRNILHVSADGASSEVVTNIIRELKSRRLNVKKLINARDKYIGGELCMLIRGKDKGRDSWHYVEVSRGLMEVFMNKTRGGTIDVAKYGTLLFSGWGPDPDDDTAQEIEKRFEARRNNNQEDPDATPLHIAAFKDKPDVAEVLLEHGADPNIRDKFGMTPLHVAAMRGNMGLVRRLIEVGSTPEALDCLVKTPADIAEDNEHKDIANYLKGVRYLPIAEKFRTNVLPNIQQLVSADHIRSVHESGADLRTHLINTLRDLTVDINETLLSLGSGPVLEESCHRI